MKTIENNTNSIFSGLVQYLGGKRKIVKLIAKYSVGKTFCDLFFGGGSVGLYMKAQGYRVLASDHSVLSSVIGRAYLENNRERITEEDIKRFFVPQNENHFTRDTYFPGLFTKRHADLIDDSVYNISKVRNPSTKNLLMVVVAKMIFFLRAFGSFTNQVYMRDFNEQNEIDMIHRSPSYYKNLTLSSWEMAKLALKYVNQSVFSNGKENIFCYSDVFDFIQFTRDQEIDTIYIDPPYYGSLNYENYYSVVNKILTMGRCTENSSSCFNSESKYLDSIKKILSLTKHIKRLLFSYGGYRGIKERDALVSLVREVRGGELECIQIPYSYSLHRTNGNGSDAPEILIVSST